LQFRYEAPKFTPLNLLKTVQVGEKEGVYDKIHSLRKMPEDERGYNKVN